MTRHLLIWTVFSTLTSCCTDSDPDFNFDNNEPKHLLCYRPGDTIYFQNANNDLDTITVLSVDSVKGQHYTGLISRPPSGKSCWVTIKHLPVDHWHFGSQTTGIEYWKLIRITKDPEEGKAEFQFQYRDFVKIRSNLVKLNTDTLTINEKEITNYYLMNHSYPDRVKDSTDIETIIWTDSQGLTAYKNKRGDWWTKK